MTTEELCNLLQKKLEALFPELNHHSVRIETKIHGLKNKYQKNEYTLVGSAFPKGSDLTDKEIEEQKVWIYITGNTLKEVVQKFCVELLLGKEKYDKLQIELSNKEIKEVLNECN